ncbi:hypothetical protein L0337_09980 [candidate division KSB1 bacterium]|nr:hypothetical protein [candidate division KSB1 bacterium]
MIHANPTQPDQWGKNASIVNWIQRDIFTAENMRLNATIRKLLIIMAKQKSCTKNR